MISRKDIFFIWLVLLVLINPAQANASRSYVQGDLLHVPRIDVEGIGPLSLNFRIVLDQEYLLILESAEDSSSAISNSGVFDPVALTIDIDEVVLENGDVYVVQLSLLEQGDENVFRISDAIALNVSDPSVPDDPGEQPLAEAEAMYQALCSTCHGDSGAGTQAGPALTACANCGSIAVLADYIRDTMPLGQPASCDSDCALLLANYVNAVFNGSNQQVANKTVGFISLLDDSVSLRRAAQQLSSRLPSLEEYQLLASSPETGLSMAVDSLMEEESFYRRLGEIFNDYLLTDKYHSRNGSEAAISLLSRDDFPDRRWFDPGKEMRDENYSYLRQATNNGIAREPLALISHVVRNNLPFTEILTADYMLVSPFSAQSYGIDGLSFEDSQDAEEFVLARLPGIPHAGILTSPMFLNRYPTTKTNRNRGRARVVFDLFLDTDILAIEGVRPGNAVDLTTPVPTIDNPQCSKCHSVLDPVASVFQNWNQKGQYRPARLDRYGWYPDMEPRGFNGQIMPLQGNIDSSIQWLAEQIANDPRFPRAVTRIIVNGLTGKEPLRSPSEDASQALVDAYVAERTVLDQIQSEFVADNFNLKTLIKGVVLSPYWRAEGLTAEANQLAHANTGSNYLLSPEQLDRKIETLFGFQWRRTLDSYYKDRNSSWSSRLNNTFHQIYGGIDSDSVVSRLKTPNGLMGAMQIRMANELACYAVPHDFWLPEEQRLLFKYVDKDYSPYLESGQLDQNALANIRLNIQYLHEYLLGEKLPLDSPELDISQALFLDVLNRGRELILNGENEWSVVRLHSDCDRTKDFQGEALYEKNVRDDRLVEDRQFLIRAWMSVVAYLLADYRFFYS